MDSRRKGLRRGSTREFLSLLHLFVIRRHVTPRHVVNQFGGTVVAGVCDDICITRDDVGYSLLFTLMILLGHQTNHRRHGCHST